MSQPVLAVCGAGVEPVLARPASSAAPCHAQRGGDAPALCAASPSVSCTHAPCPMPSRAGARSPAHPSPPRQGGGCPARCPPALLQAPASAASSSPPAWQRLAPLPVGHRPGPVPGWVAGAVPLAWPAPPARDASLWRQQQQPRVPPEGPGLPGLSPPARLGTEPSLGLPHQLSPCHTQGSTWVWLGVLLWSVLLITFY